MPQYIDQIFLESRPALDLPLGAGHLYLVRRTVLQLDDGTILNVPTANDLVIQGSIGLPANLTVNVGLLESTSDGYGTTGTPENRFSLNISSIILGANALGSVAVAWDVLASIAREVLDYRYGLPPISDGVAFANSGGVIASVLNSAGVDVREIIWPATGARYVESHHAFGHPGADMQNATLLGYSGSQTIEASQKLMSGILLLGRDSVDDILIGTKFSDSYWGEQVASYSTTKDTVSFRRAPLDLGGPGGLHVSFRQENISWLPEALRTEPVGVYGVNSDAAVGDLLFGIERVLLSDREDTVVVSLPSDRFHRKFVVDGGAEPSAALDDGRLGDLLDFSAADRAVYLGPSGTQGSAALYEGFSVGLGTLMFRFLSLFLPISEASTSGFFGARNIEFTNFEYVRGSAFSDSINLSWINPATGAITAAQAAALNALQINFPQGHPTPAAIGAAYQDFLQAHLAIGVDRGTIKLEGGDGDDNLSGSSIGVSIIDGGTGVDYLYAGDFYSILNGGEDHDYIAGGGLGSELYGGAGGDLFDLAANAVVRDATPEDVVKWGAFRLTGGVTQWWQETGWAYNAPFSSILNANPIGFVTSVFSATIMQLDLPFIQTVRYTVTKGGTGADGLPGGHQLIVQFARGQGGQAVVDNYKIDVNSGEATGGVVVFQQTLTVGKQQSLADLYQYLNLALKAGFGTGLSGSDPSYGRKLVTAGIGKAAYRGVA